MGIKTFAGVSEGKVRIDDTTTVSTYKTVKELKADLALIDARRDEAIARHQLQLDAYALAKAEIREHIKQAKDAGLKDE